MTCGRQSFDRRPSACILFRHSGRMAGYGDGRFTPDDPVSPQMACTVILS